MLLILHHFTKYSDNCQPPISIIQNLSKSFVNFTLFYKIWLKQKFGLSNAKCCGEGFPDVTLSKTSLRVFFVVLSLLLAARTWADSELVAKAMFSSSSSLSLSPIT